MDLRLETLSAFEIGEKVNNREITPTEVIDYFFARIEKYNPSVNAFVYTRYEEAKAKAKEMEDRLSKGEYIGPFAGVPFGLKDFLPSKKGWTNSKGGIKSMIDVDDHDSVFCEAMEKAGGIAIGKTNAPSFGFSGTTGNNLYGATHNPFDLSRNSGGSSGGSAAAVAAGLVPIAEGGDAGGSIRVPASWCNLFGYKASVGSIPSVSRPDAWAATHPYCFNGGLTKTVQDAAILMNFMMHHDPRDPLSIERKPLDLSLEMLCPTKNLRIAYTPDFGIFEVDEEIRDLFLKRMESLRDKGYQVELVPFHLNRTLDELGTLWCQSISADTAIMFELSRMEGNDLLEKAKDELPEEFIRINREVSKATLLDYYRFNCIRTEIYDAFQDIFDEYDLLLSPITCCKPVKNLERGKTHGPTEINGKPINPLIGFAETFLVNFTGHPAASVPLGLSEEGLPMGMQVIGRRFHDETVFAFSRTMENLYPWFGYFLKTGFYK